MSLSFSLPPTIENGPVPVWNGKGFQVGSEFTTILQYSLNSLGWNDELTFFHEESAGDHHFIDCASRDHALQQLITHSKNEQETILEIGCSSGFMLEKIHAAFPKAMLMGSDVVSEPLKKIATRMPTIPLFRFDLVHCPLPDNSIDAIVILNVLEHIENDQAALQQIYRILKPGGIVIIEVPAGPNLYDVYDKVLMHFRRYRLQDLARSAKKQGFHILKQSHLGFFLYPPFWLIKQRNKKLLSAPVALQRQQVEKAIRNTLKNKMMSSLMKGELFLGKFFAYPVGIRCLLTGQK